MELTEQTPVAPPRRKKREPSMANSDVDTTAVATPATGPGPLAKSKPARPQPPKLRPQAPLSPSGRATPPRPLSGSSSPGSTRYTSQRPLAQCYTAGSLSTPKQTLTKTKSCNGDKRNSSLTIINSRNSEQVYCNVAPRPPQNARSRVKQKGLESKGHVNVQRLSVTRKTSNSRQVANSRAVQPLGNVPLSKTDPTREVDSVPTKPDRRRDFTKQPLPKKQERLPTRPAPPPPRPYELTERRLLASKSVSKESDEYTYVNPEKCRYLLSVKDSRLSRDLDGLNLSGYKEFNSKDYVVGELLLNAH